MNTLAAKRPELSTRGMAALGFASVIVTALLYALPRVSFKSLRLLDVDGYMRAQRVVDLLAGQNSWFDPWVYRANAPFGHALHWTRPVDAILIALSWPFTLFNDLKGAVFLGSFVFGLLMSLGLFFAVAWAARAVVGRGASYLAGGTTAFQLGLVSYNSPGHPDHHGMILLLSVFLIGHTLRLLQGHEETLAIRAGVIGALGLWVATEFLLPLVVCALALVVKWIVSGESLQSVRLLTFTLAGSLLIAVALERPPGQWTVFESERVSALHVVMAVLLSAAAWLLGKFRVEGAIPRLVAIFGLAVAMAASLQVIFPGFFLGPIQAIQPSVDRFLDDYVTELAPTWHSVGQEWAGVALVLGAPALAILQGIERVWTNRNGQLFSSWLLILGWLAATFGLAILSFRFVPIAEVLVGIPLAAAAEQLLARSQRPPLVRPVLIVWSLVGYLVLVVASSAFASEGEVPPPSSCSFETIEEQLAQNLDSQQTTVLAGVPYGPELLWRLPVDVVGTPYLNSEGIQFTEDVFRSSDVGHSLTRLDERGIDAIVVCDGEAGSAGYLDSGSFYRRLLAGEPIQGWKQLALSGESSFRIYLR